MRHLQLISAALLPHAPLLLEGVGRPAAPSAAIRDAVAGLGVGAGELTIVLSPHGRHAGVYRSASGSLAGVGLPQIEAGAEPENAVAGAMAEAWGRPLLDEPLDHGAVVPMLLADIRGPTVVACLTEVTGPYAAEGKQAIEEGLAFAEALAEVDGPSAALLASAHSGAALSPRGPLGERSGAVALEERLKDAIATDPSRLASLAEELHGEGAACGTGVFAALSRLATDPGEVAAYDASNGVGYLVAELPT